MASNPVPDQSASERRWTIYKALGREDDVIEGPDVDGLRVAPVDELVVLRGRIAALQRALHWYADPETYDAIGPLGTVKGSAWRLAEDGGARARAALDEERA